MTLQDPGNLADLFWYRVRETPEPPASRQPDGRAGVDLTWAEAGRATARWQAALAREGLKRGERVALCLHNRVEWGLFDQAALSLRLVTVPLDCHARPDNMACCLNDSGARLLLLEDAKLWPALRDRARSIERVVCLDGATARGGD